MSKVALTRGDSRRKNIFESLKLIEKEIREKVKGKKVLIKPNFTSSRIQKAATHIEQIRGILDFLSEVYEGKITIGEGSGENTFEGFSNFGYFKLKDEYQLPIEFIDLNKDGFEMIPSVALFNCLGHPSEGTKGQVQWGKQSKLGYFRP